MCKCDETFKYEPVQWWLLYIAIKFETLLCFHDNYASSFGVMKKNNDDILAVSWTRLNTIIYM